MDLGNEIVGRHAIRRPDNHGRLARIGKDGELAKDDDIGIRHGAAEDVDEALGLGDVVAGNLERTRVVLAEPGVIRNQQDSGHPADRRVHRTVIIQSWPPRRLGHSAHSGRPFGELAESLHSDWVEGLSAVVLVEGVSDQLALEALAARRGRKLEAEDVAIVPMGGATNIGSFLDRFGPHGAGVRLAGLCDAGEEGDFRRGLERAGLGSNLSRHEMEGLGFYVCVADLEDELIRALGAAAVERVIENQGELESFRTFQRQPQWRGRTTEGQLRRFLGTHSGRKIQSAALLVDALDLGRVPRPLDRVLAYV